MRARVIIVLLFVASHLMAKQFEVTGRVLSLNNVPIAGVNVILMGTGNGTATDMTGHFRIHLPEGRVVLAFLFLKQKPFEHTFDIRPGFQYQINVTLANKTQTFNKGFAITAELPLNSPVIRGRVIDQDHHPLYGVNVTQGDDGFRSVTDANGYFFLPVPTGKNNIRFRSPGTKEIHYVLDSNDDASYELEVVLVEDRARYRTQQSSAKLRTNDDLQQGNNN